MEVREVISYVSPEMAKKYQHKKNPRQSLKDMSEEEKKEYRRQEQESRGMSRDSLRNMGFASALNSDERRFKLVAALRAKEIQTVQASAKYMGLSEGTIRKYLREENIGIYDAKIDNYLTFNNETEIILFDFDLV